VLFLLLVTVVAVAVMVGARLSTTVTVALQVLMLPAASLTVRVTVLFPMLEQLKLVLLRVSIRLPAAVQLSDDPLLTCAVVKVACPDAFKVRVTGWQTATGGVLSVTVTLKVQGLLTLFDASRTV
jgi:hypothetical protein